jgi:quercetin dioxygenase-like cupin family protein
VTARPVPAADPGAGATDSAAGTRLASGPLAWARVDAEPVADGITGRTLAGEHLSSTVFELAPGAVIPRHAHESEELGVVLRGGLRMSTGDGDAYEVRAGDSFFVAGATPHEGVALDDGCTLLECYSPPRVPAPSSRDEAVGR